MTQEEKQLLLTDLCMRIPYKAIVKCRIIDFNIEEYAHDNSRKNTRYPEYIGNGYLFLVDVLSNRVQIRPIIENMEYVEASYFESMCNKGYTSIDDCKPYLRTMSNMTEEEKETISNLWKDNNKLVFADPSEIRRYKFYDISVVDFLNSHHFDYRGLIDKGLAIKAPENMYKITI